MGLRKMTAEDLLSVKCVADPQISPDGKLVAYVQAQADGEKDKYGSNIWMVGFDSGEPRQFTFGPGSDAHPRWSPDGARLAFVSDRAEGRNQIWLIDLNGGEARQLTNLKVGAGGPVWSPDGRKIAFLAHTNAEDEDDASGGNPREAKRSDANGKPKASDVTVVTRLDYKADGQGLLKDRRAHLWTIDLDSGTAKQLTHGDRDESSPMWSADGSALVFATYRGPDPDLAFKVDLWQVPVAGGEPSLLAEHPGPAEGLSLSPCGQFVAFTGHDNHAHGATNPGLWLAPMSGGKSRLISGGFDRPVDGAGILGDSRAPTGLGGAGPTWSSDGASIYCLSIDHGQASLCRFPVDGGRPTTLIDGDRRMIGAFSFSRDMTRVAFTVETPERPCEIYARPADGTERRLTRANDTWLDAVEISSPERFTFTGADGCEVEGWLMKPAGFEAGAKYPLIHQVHGGPHMDYGYGFFHEFQYLASQGWGVMYINPHGSKSYGEDFTTACMGSWGAKDYEDLMRGLDHAIANNAWIDTDRLFLTGGSYGGYMTNWIVGHTARYRAAVTQRSLSNIYSFFGTSDAGWYFPAEFGALPWDDAARVMAHSPIQYANSMVTPLLILHSERDIRAPMEQAEQLFVALRILKRDVEFVRFPDECHDLSRSGKPAHRIERLSRIVGWFGRHGA